MKAMGSLIAVGALALLCSAPASIGATGALPTEPDVEERLDELYDHEARMFVFLYSLNGTGKVDYVTARMVQTHSRSNYGNPVYYTKAYPLFYWYDHIMWNDPEQDGVNGNEQVYAENVDFDPTRYKPCLFNGQLC